MVKYNRNISLVLCAILIANASLSLIPYINTPLVIIVSLLIMTRKERKDPKIAKVYSEWIPGVLKSRVEITRLLCTYVKENKLANPENKRHILGNDAFRNLLKYTSETITYPDMQKYLHVVFIKPVVAETVVEPIVEAPVAAHEEAHEEAQAAEEVVEVAPKPKKRVVRTTKKVKQTEQ